MNDGWPLIDSLSSDDNQQNNKKVDAEEEEVTDTKSVATSVMSESSIGSIHSKKSLTVLVAKVKERVSNNIIIMPTINEDELEGGEVVKEKAVPTPVISTVTDDNGARMAEKRSINKLAFKNRNPAL